MSRAKPDGNDASGRGRPVKLPDWWLVEVNCRCGDRPHQQIAEELSAASKRQPPFRREAVGDFLNGKVTTDAMMGAFLALFTDLPPPVFFASSLEEAKLFKQLADLHRQASSVTNPDSRVSETIEDTREQAKATTGKRRRIDHVAKRAK